MQYGALAVVLAYLIGSVPFALLTSRRSGVDLRTVGSGNVGASNVLRTVGIGSSLWTVCLDAGKGALAVLVAQRLTTSPVVSMAAGVAAVVGHVFPVWLGFRGGKGVATTAGVFAVLAPVACGVAAAAFVFTVGTTRYVSVGSTMAALVLVGVIIGSRLPAYLAIGAAVTAVLIVMRHRANFARLMAGTEHRLGSRASTGVAR